MLSRLLPGSARMRMRGLLRHVHVKPGSLTLSGSWQSTRALCTLVSTSTSSSSPSSFSSSFLARVQLRALSSSPSSPRIPSDAHAVPVSTPPTPATATTSATATATGEQQQQQKEEEEQQRGSSNSSDGSQQTKKKRPYFKMAFAAWLVWSVAAYADLRGLRTLRGDSSEGSGDLDLFSTAVQLLPTRLVSRMWGAVHELTLPVFMRAPLYNLWTRMYDCKLDEMADPDLNEYPNLKSFFVRRLKEGVRPIAAGELVSPVDALCTVVGKVTPGMQLEQIKGQSYDLNKFLGTQDVQAALQSGKNLYHCVLYLAPGDYHRIHSACDWEIDHRTHFAGECMPVAPWLVERVPWLFTRNERIVLKGRWAHGFFSLCPVAALNVGNMKLALPNDDQLVTNRAWQRGLVNQTWVLQYLPAWAQKQIACTAEDLPTDHTWTHAPTTDPIVATTAYPKPYSPAVSSQKGQEIARFELGSTVVLVFEAEDCEFLIQPGQKVKLGQQIANVK